DARPAKSPAHGDDDATEMPSAERIYTVQVMWDETMADTAAKWLAANPGGHVILLAGNGHCHDTAIINRMKRRGVGEALGKPINDYVVVLQMPAEVRKANAGDREP